MYIWDWSWWDALLVGGIVMVLWGLYGVGYYRGKSAGINEAHAHVRELAHRGHR